MNWFDVLGKICLSFMLLVVAIGVIALLSDFIADKYRRKKYPEYFSLYNSAIRKAVDIADEFNRRNTYIEHRIQVYQNGLLEGECTDESHKRAMDQIMENYRVLAQWYRTQQLEVDRLTKEADKYAKDHGLKWGYIYDGK